jgi:hypothetical protein
MGGIPLFRELRQVVNRCDGDQFGVLVAAIGVGVEARREPGADDADTDFAVGCDRFLGHVRQSSVYLTINASIAFFE